MPELPEPAILDPLTPSEIVQLVGSDFASLDPDRWRFTRWALAAVTFAVAGVAVSRIAGHWFDLRLVGLWLPCLLIAGVVGAAAVREWQHGFPGKQNSLLVDGTTWVSTHQFVRTILKAALVANERAGVIVLTVDRGGDQPRVMATPAGGDPPGWHHATLEQRLELRGTRAVADIVYEWLGRDSPDPWRRALEQSVTMLRVRGVITPVARRWYESDRFSAVRVPAADVADVTALLARLESDRPEVSELLDREIAVAMTQRTRAAQKSSEGTPEPTPSPWLDERAEDRQRLGFGPPVAKIVPVWGSLLILVAASGGAAYVADRFDATRLTLATAAVTSVLAVMLVRYQLRRPELGQVLWQRAAEWQQKRSGDAGRGELLDVPVVPHMTAAATWVGSLAMVPIVTIFVVLMYMTDLRPLLVPVAGAALWGLVKLRARVSQSIADVVLQSTHEPARPAELIADGESHADLPPAPTRESARSPLASPLTLDIVDMRSPGTLPAPTAASQARLDAVRQRPIRMRAHFRRGVLIAAGLALLFAVAGWLVGAPSFPFTTAMFAIGTAFVVGPTGAAVARLGIVQLVTRIVLGPFVSVSGVQGGDIDEGTASPRPVVLSLVLGAWLVLASLAAVDLARTPMSPWTARSAAAAGLIVVVLLVIWFQRTRVAIERAYPFVAPQQLLALRVFGSPHLADFLDLTNEWQWIGVRLRLDGPGTTGHKLRDLVNFAAGRLDRSIVEDDAELTAALADFRERPDKRLRFPVNSVQCSNRVWKDAVDRLLDRSDAVVMDLASLGPQNKGVAYEVGRLFARIALARIVLLIDDSTDREVLRELVANAWAAIPSDSPNAHASEPSLRVFDMGGGAERRADESRAEWQRRQVRVSDRRRLVGLLVDASLPPRADAGSGATPDAATVHWSRTLPSPVRLLRNVGFGLFLLFQILTIACQP